MQQRQRVSQEPTKEDVEAVLRALNRKGAPGADGLTGQIFKMVGPVMGSLVRRLLEMFFFNGTPPEAWEEGIMAPVWKKGDTLDPSNYRPVGLLAKLYKGVETALLRRLNEVLARAGGLHSTNLAYQKGKGREMALFLLIGSVLHRQFNWPGELTLIALLDVQHAYNGVNLHRLGLDLWERGTRGKVWKLIMEMILSLRWRVRVNGRLSRPFQGKAIPQGATLSPTEFILFKDELAWALQECQLPGVGATLVNGTVMIGAL